MSYESTVLLTDFIKAFNGIDHEIAISKLVKLDVSLVT